MTALSGQLIRKRSRSLGVFGKHEAKNGRLIFEESQFIICTELHTTKSIHVLVEKQLELFIIIWRSRCRGRLVNHSNRFRISFPTLQQHLIMDN